LRDRRSREKDLPKNKKGADANRAAPFFMAALILMLNP